MPESLVTSYLADHENHTNILAVLSTGLSTQGFGKPCPLTSLVFTRRSCTPSRLSYGGARAIPLTHEKCSPPEVSAEYFQSDHAHRVMMEELGLPGFTLSAGVVWAPRRSIPGSFRLSDTRITLCLNPLSYVGLIPQPLFAGRACTPNTVETENF